jgi:FAD dependent oxidoreductase TIGR03364
VTVTGQRTGDTWRRALRTRDLWLDVCRVAGIPIIQRGLMLAYQSNEAQAVAHAFLETPMGAALEKLAPDEAIRRVPALRSASLLGALYSPHELRIEPRTAIHALSRWLQHDCKVQFLYDTAVTGVSEGSVTTSRGEIRADRIAVCPGPDLRTLFPEVFEGRGTTLCKLQMLRVRPRAGVQLTHPVMGDLSLVRYAGYTALPASHALRLLLEAERGEALEHGIHIIAVACADGSWIVGDSHHYAASPDPFADTAIERRILHEANRLIDLDGADVVERWSGLYPSGQQDCFTEAMTASIRLVSVTSGTGMSTGLAIGEELMASWN